MFKSINEYSVNITFFIAIPAVAMMIILAPNIVNFIVFDNVYWDNASIKNAILATSILASLMFTFSVSENIYQQVLIPIKKERYYLFAIIVGVILNISYLLFLV